MVYLNGWFIILEERQYDVTNEAIGQEEKKQLYFFFFRDTGQLLFPFLKKKIEVRYNTFSHLIQTKQKGFPYFTHECSRNIWIDKCLSDSLVSFAYLWQLTCWNLTLILFSLLKTEKFCNNLVNIGNSSDMKYEGTWRKHVLSKWRKTEKWMFVFSHLTGKNN